jgi:hypothetical protein
MIARFKHANFLKIVSQENFVTLAHDLHCLTCQTDGCVIGKAGTNATEISTLVTHAFTHVNLSV